MEEVVLADCAVLRRCPLIPALGSPACLPACPASPLLQATIKVPKDAYVLDFVFA